VSTVVWGQKRTGKTGENREKHVKSGHRPQNSNHTPRELRIYTILFSKVFSTIIQCCGRSNGGGSNGIKRVLDGGNKQRSATFSRTIAFLVLCLYAMDRHKIGLSNDTEYVHSGCDLQEKTSKYILVKWQILLIKGCNRCNSSSKQLSTSPGRREPVRFCQFSIVQWKFAFLIYS
jgi:hypothetical protein